MFSKLFKFNKKGKVKSPQKINFDLNRTALILAYEVARSDGDIDSKEILYLENLIAENENKTEIIRKLKDFSDNSSSFYNQIREINQNCSREEKEGIISILWEVAYSDEYLEVHEERIIRRIADLINIKDIRVLKLKNDSKNNASN